MLISTSQFKRFTAEAIDGEVGRVDDFYFPRGEWIIRYLLIKATFESMGRRALISTGSVQEILYNRKAVRLSLTSEQIRNSPETDVSEPVSLRHEIELNQYYGWPADWLQEQHDVTPIGEMSGEPERQEADDMEEYTGPQLQSISEITGLFQIQANDVEIGKLTDFIIDDETWLIQYLTVEFSESPTGNIILSSNMVERIDWIGGYISVNALLETIKSSPAYDPSKLLTEKQIQTLHAHYG